MPRHYDKALTDNERLDRNRLAEQLERQSQNFRQRNEAVRARLAGRSENLRNRANNVAVNVQDPVRARTAPGRLDVPPNLGNPQTAFREAQRIQASSNRPIVPDAFTGETQPLASARRPAPVASVQPGAPSVEATETGSTSGAVDETQATANERLIAPGASLIDSEGQLRAAIGRERRRPAGERELSFGDVGSGARFQLTDQGRRSLADRASRATTLDSSAFQRESQQFYDNQEARQGREARNALRRRIMRGGFGANRAAASLAALEEQDNEAAANASTTDLAKLALKQQGQFFDQALARNRESRAEDALTRQNIESFVNNAYTDPERRAQQFRLLSSGANALPGLQSVQELARFNDLYSKFVQDTGSGIGQLTGGLIGDADRSPLEALSEISDIRLLDNGALQVQYRDPSITADNSGVELVRDLSPNEATEFYELWTKGRGRRQGDF